MPALDLIQNTIIPASGHVELSTSSMKAMINGALLLGSQAGTN